MKDIMSLNKNEVSMNTVEIAELTGKRSDHVKRDAHAMLSELHGIDLPKFGEIYKDSHGRDQECYRLPKREILILVSGYSIPLRAAIIDRLAQLENNSTFSIPHTLSGALRLAADQAEQIEQQKLQIAQDKPLVEFAKTVEGTDKKVSIGDMAKLHGGIGRNNLFKKLRENKILISGGRDNNKPYQAYMDRGYFEVTETIVKRTNGDVINFTSYVTGKGQVWLMDKINDWLGNDLLSFNVVPVVNEEVTA